jgi:hypothetical protein
MTHWEHLSGPGLRTFFRIVHDWGLATPEQMALLGTSDEAAFHGWSHGDTAMVTDEVLERISALLSIYRALHTLFSDPVQADGWPHRMHVDGPFFGATALEHMLRNGPVGAEHVRDYLMDQLS